MPFLGQAPGQLGIASHQCLTDVPASRTRQNNQSLYALQPLATHFSAPTMRVRQPGPGQKLAESQVSSTVSDQK